MARRSGNSKASNHRCRVVLNILFTNEERGISLGPGSIVGETEYAEMMERKLATPDMFEEVRDDADGPTPASEE